MDVPSTQDNPARKPAEPAAAEPRSDKDLSQQIEQAVEREPLDQVKCVRVFGNYYRCNWWSRAGAQSRLEYNWAGLLMDVIRKSCFLSVTMQAGQLVIKEVGASAGGKEGVSVGGRSGK